MVGQRKLRPVPFTDVKLEDGFWAPRQRTGRQVTLPVVYTRCQETGRIDALRLEWQPGESHRPHQFWDSDVAKWLEGAAYTLAQRPDQALEEQVDAVVDLLAAAQQEDGYLNSYYTVVEPENRWTNLRDMHELYCAGHLMEAAVALYEATGKDRLLQVMCRYADYIDRIFGPGEDQKHGYPGHEEIELALVKLYRATDEERYLRLAQFFVDERGQQPHYYDAEAHARGENPADSHFGGHYEYNQSHVPVREQEHAEGHAVRAMYLYSGMVDVASETGDEALMAACRRLWRSVTQRRMYITGGVGSASWGERFTADYDLPNQLAYAETCAAIGLVFWSHRMLQMEADAEYADVMERALYNGVASGVSLEGDTFFYANLLEVNPERFEYRPDLFRHTSVSTRRQPWFRTSCCPVNVARLVPSLGQYAYSQTDDALYVHLYAAGEAEAMLADGAVLLRQEGNYPWDGEVTLTVMPEEPLAFDLLLRIPGWCRKVRLAVNSEEVPVAPLERGYVRIGRQWRDGDRVSLSLAMPVERVRAHPRVRANAGRVALMRGPIVYCLEEVDNGPNLADVALLPDAELEATYDPDLLGGVSVIRGEGRRSLQVAWDDALYRAALPPREAVEITAVPYCVWANRAPGEMIVWLREG